MFTICITGETITFVHTAILFSGRREIFSCPFAIAERNFSSRRDDSKRLASKRLTLRLSLLATIPTSRGSLAPPRWVSSFFGWSLDVSRLFSFSSPFLAHAVSLAFGNFRIYLESLVQVSLTLLGLTFDFRRIILFSSLARIRIPEPTRCSGIIAVPAVPPLFA